MLKYKKIVALLIPIVVLLSFTITSFAQDGNSFRNDKYISNYTFDIETVGFMDLMEKGLNSIASMIFQMGVYIAKVTCELFDWAFKFDMLGILPGSKIQHIMESLSKVFFTADSELFILIIVACTFFFAMCMFKGNFVGILGQIMKMAGIIALATFLSINTSVLLGMLNSVTTAISTEVITTVTDIANEGESMEKVADVLWNSLVHLPWTELQMTGVSNEDNKKYKDEVEELLSIGTGTEERQAKVDILAQETGGFKKQVAGVRAGAALLFVIVICVKSLLFLAIAGIKVFFQIVTILLVLCAPIVLVISLVPQMGGTRTLGVWFKKIIENQIYIVLLSLMTGFIIAGDNWCYTGFGKDKNWIIITVAQIIISVSVILGKDKIFSLMEIIGVSIHNEGAMLNNKIRNMPSGLHAMDNANISGQVKKYKESYDKYYKPKVDQAMAMGSNTIARGYSGMVGAVSATRLGTYAADKKENFTLIQEDEKRDAEEQAKKSAETAQKVQQHKQQEFTKKMDNTLTSVAPSISSKLYLNTPYASYKSDKEEKVRTALEPDTSHIPISHCEPDWDHLPEPREQLPPKVISRRQPSVETVALDKSTDSKEVAMTTTQKVNNDHRVRDAQGDGSIAERRAVTDGAVVSFPIKPPARSLHSSASASSYSNELQDAKTIMYIGATGFTKYGHEQKKVEKRPSLTQMTPKTKQTIKQSEKKAVLKDKTIRKKKMNSADKNNRKKKIAV